MIVSVSEKAVGIGPSLLVVIVSFRNLSRLNSPIIWIKYAIRFSQRSCGFVVQVWALGAHGSLSHGATTRLRVVLLCGLFL